MKKRIYFFCLCAALFCSCTTVDKARRFEKDVCMFVMIYDYANNGVNDVSVYKDEKEVGVSDIRGRYIIDKGIKPEFNLRFTKKGYEDVGIDVRFDPFTVLYIKMGTAAQFLHLAEEQADAYRYEQALEYIERALRIDAERCDVLYFKAVVLYKMQKFEEAKKVILELKQKQEKNEYVDRLENKISAEKGNAR